jgi:hypothetical protein
VHRSPLPRSVLGACRVAVVGATVACCHVAVPADAAVISNKDSKTYGLIIEERGSQSRHELAPGDSLDEVCLRGCVVVLVDVNDGAYQLPEGNEIVTIEDGVLFYDGAVAPRPDTESAPEETAPR